MRIDSKMPRPAVVHVELKALHRHLRTTGLSVPKGEPVETQNLIYALIEPDSDAIRYIGLSAVGLDRPRHHGRLSTIMKDRTAKGEWVASLLRRRVMFRVAILVWGVRDDDLADLERACIAYYRKKGTALTNANGGGATGDRTTLTGMERLARREAAEDERNLQAMEKNYINASGSGRRSGRFDTWPFTAGPQDEWF